MPGDEWTRDSRFLRRNLATGEVELFGMYSRNIRVEGDGLGYPELNLVRAIFLEPFLMCLMGTNMLLVYSQELTDRTFWTYFAHMLGLGFNIVRIVASCGIFLGEILAFPFRVVFGCLLAPIGFKLSAGHIYALACSTIHRIMRGEGLAIVRHVKICNKFECEVKSLNAGGLGEVLWYRARDVAEASYIGATFKIQQRCGSGPECIWIRGRYVFVSFWSPISMNVLFRKSVKTSWKLLDIKTDEWRITVFDFEDKSLLSERYRERMRKNGNLLGGEGDEENGDVDALTSILNLQETSRSQGSHTAGPTLGEDMGPNNIERDGDAPAWALVGSDVHLGAIANLAELEEYYNSPLGWNKYHLMRAEGSHIRITRHDRRVFAHLFAAISSLSFYLQFRDSSEGWFGLSIDLYGLVLANYAVVTAYAAEILIGKVSDIVDAKSDRYGVIVTRAIDRGYVRGFHVVNGDWLRYKNGDCDLPKHEVTNIEVNVTCNSFVFPSENGMKIRTYGYQRDRGDVQTWRGSEKGDLVVDAAQVSEDATKSVFVRCLKDFMSGLGTANAQLEELARSKSR